VAGKIGSCYATYKDTHKDTPRYDTEDFVFPSTRAVIVSLLHFGMEFTPLLLFAVEIDRRSPAAA